MNTLKLERKRNYLIITLDRGKSSPINRQMVNELRTAIADAENDTSIGGVILTGKTNFFSTGLDVIELYGYDEPTMKAFWNDFSSMVGELAFFSKPLIASITGHSPAGGCVLAICCDYRVMAKGNYRIGLNEHQVGIAIPNNIFDLYAFWIGKGKAYQYLLEAKMLSPDDALNVGLIDELAEPDQVLARAEKKMKSYFFLEQTAWRKSKVNFRRPLKENMEANTEKAFASTLEQWWSPEGRAALKRMVDMLMAKKK